MGEVTTHGAEAADAGGFGPFATVTPGSNTSGTPMAEAALTRDPSAAVPDVSDPAATSAGAPGQARALLADYSGDGAELGLTG